MPYTTPARFCTDVGYHETRVLLVDDGQVLTIELLQQVVAVVAGTGDWAPETTAPQKVVAMAAHDTLVRKLTNTSHYMDGYLRTGGVTLPLPEGDANAGTLEDCCTAIARDELADDSGVSSEDIVNRAARWRTWLRDIAAKRATLTQPDGGDVPSSSSIRTGQAKTGFNWQAHSLGHGGWRP